MATLLPNGKQTFFDRNGSPLAGGTVTFYVPSTTTPKDTWQNTGQTVLNTNPVVLDSSGQAIIYGSGTYRQIVKDASGNTIWDQLTADTAVGGIANGQVSTGTADAQIIAESSFSFQDGQVIVFIAGFTNTGAMTVTPGSGSSPVPVLYDSPTGPEPTVADQVVADNSIMLVYEAARGAFHIVNPSTTSGSDVDITGGTITGVTISNSTLVLKQSANPTPTAEGDLQWDTNDDQMKVGDGAGTKTFSDDSKVALLAAADQVITGGARVTPLGLGTISSGTLTPDPGDRPEQYYTNNGAHTLAPGSNNGYYLLDITNGASAGAVTLSGWTKVVGSMATTNALKYRCSASIGQAGSLLVIQAMQ